MLKRRNFIVGVTALIFAPAVVRASSIMPVKLWKTPIVKIGDNLLCNGAEVSVNDYPELFSVLRNTYCGSNYDFNLPKFNLPNTDSPAIFHNIGYVISPQGVISAQVV
jgi:hypothetical protein